MKTKVRWEEWVQTFFHPLYPMGVYEPREETFESKEEANGYARGIRTNVRVQNVRVV